MRAAGTNGVDSPRRLMVDVTTSLAEAGRVAHGTTRVERSIVGALLEIQPPGLSFCCFDRMRQRFRDVGRDELVAALAELPTPETRRTALSSKTASEIVLLAKRAELMVRRHVRDPVLRQMHLLRRLRGKAELPPSTTFLSVGELRFSPRLLAGIVERSGAAFVSTIFDVLPIAAARVPTVGPAERRMLDDFDVLFRLSRLCLCISHTTLGDVTEYARLRGFSPPECVVIPLAHELPDVAPRQPPGLLAGQFVLSVGTITHRKNQRLLVDVWKDFLRNGSHSWCKLVIAGSVYEDAQDMIREIRSQPDLAERIVVLENADDSALSWLYANCRFTVFPSFLEGFGLPVAESLAVGKACVASSSSAIPEAAQGQAILLSPHDLPSWISTIGDLIGNDRRLREAEQRIARDYRPQSWADTTATILELLDARALLPRAAALNRG